MSPHPPEHPPPPHTKLIWGAQSQKTATESSTFPEVLCCWCVPIWPLGKDHRRSKEGALPQTQILGPQLSLKGKQAGTQMQGWALPQSCAAVVGALPHIPALSCWELAQTCPVRPQLIRPSLVPDLEGKLYMPKSCCHFFSPM